VYVLFSLLVVVFGVLFLLVAAFSAYGIYAMLRANQRNQAYLRDAKVEEPLQLDHVSGPLRRLVEDARMLRVSLEGPIRDVTAMRTGEFSQTAGADVEAFDSMLMNITREVAEWLDAAARLPETDAGTLEDLGSTPTRVREMLDREGGAFERKHLKRPGQPPLDARLKALAEELNRFELALQANRSVYR
jgi:hypothetical protein